MITLIVAAGSVDLKQLIKEISSADYIIACDGGLSYLEQIKVSPDIIMGDFDSYIGDIPAKSIVFNPEKDFSDLEASIEKAIDANSDKIRILGASGSRQDHFMTAVLSLFRYDVDIRIIDKNNEILIKQGNFIIEKDSYHYFSLLFLEDAVVSIEGAKYEIEEQEVIFGRSLTLSNEFKENKVKVKTDKACIVIKSRQ